MDTSDDDDEPATPNDFCVPSVDIGVQENRMSPIVGCVCFGFVCLMIVFMIVMLVLAFTQ